MDYKELIIKFFAKEISDSEILLLKLWLEQNPENRRIFDEENELWQESNGQVIHEHFKTDTAWIKVSSKLRIRKNRSNSIAIVSRKQYHTLIAAASVACLLALGGFSLWKSEKRSFQKIEAASTIISTNEGEKAHIFLSDSTKIFINSESTLEYSGDFNINDRVVKLAGEAFFDVHTNIEKPFVVQLAQMSISATGTRFNVLSYGKENRIEITLEEGEIQVLIKDKEPIYVKCGQQVVYFVDIKNVLVRDVATDTYTSWKENKLRFNDTPFEEVLRKIGRKYNVVFEITNRDLLDLKYTATFIDESIEDIMQMLRSVSPITYKIYYRTLVNDKQYLKPRIVVGKRKT